MSKGSHCGASVAGALSGGGFGAATSRPSCEDELAVIPVRMAFAGCWGLWTALRLLLLFSIVSWSEWVVTYLPTCCQVMRFAFVPITWIALLRGGFFGIFDICRGRSKVIAMTPLAQRLLQCQFIHNIFVLECVILQFEIKIVVYLEDPETHRMEYLNRRFLSIQFIVVNMYNRTQHCAICFQEFHRAEDLSSHLQHHLVCFVYFFDFLRTSSL